MKTAVVITSIATAENQVLQQFAAGCQKMQFEFILVGDKKSPSQFELPGCTFFSIEAQLKSVFKTAQLAPLNHYARKNSGYLLAIKNGAGCIIESDDDNMPDPKFWQPTTMAVSGQVAPNETWINPYFYFGCPSIYPRGYHLQANKQHDFSAGNTITVNSPIQQALSNGAPDIDAITRLKHSDDFYFSSKAPLILPQHAYSPFNSQNTRWLEVVFPLLYLPSTCSFRTTDIWRSFIAKRILDASSFQLSFHAPNVFQKRNPHNIYDDLDLEADNYLLNGSIVEKLKALPLQSGIEFITQNLRSCYKMMVENKFLSESELPLLEAWLSDLELCKN